MMRWPALVVALALAVPLLAGSPAYAQTQNEDRIQIPEDFRRPDRPLGQVDLIDLRRRLIELDRLLSLGSLSRAESLLNELEQHSVLQRELNTRRIELAQLKGDHEEAARLCREALAGQPNNPALWRELATSQLALAQPDSARSSLGRFIAANPNGRSAAMVGVDMLLVGGEPRLAVALLDTMRLVLQEPRFMGRQRAAALLYLGEQDAAADEISVELRRNPFNLALLRSEILQGPFDPARHGEFVSRLAARSAEPQARPAEALMAANLMVEAGDPAAAVALVEPLAENPTTLATMLQNTSVLARELELTDDPRRRSDTAEYLLEILPRLATQESGDLVLRRRAADQLAMTCETALAAGILGDDPHLAADRFGELLDVVRRVHPTSERLYTSQIKLAIFTRDELHEPQVAARRLERLLLNLDLPTEGVALVRLTMGECYLAAGDTSRARTVLDNLGRDPRFRREGGHAHYHLARLDLAQGHYGTARDRFAVVALDNPAAPYANEALEMGLAVAEEMDNPSGGPNILAMYSESVYADLTADPAGRRVALEEFTTRAAATLDLSEPQHLLERARLELALVYLEDGDTALALDLLELIVADHPDGRQAPRALEVQGRIRLGAGEDQLARTVWERLLAQYPDYLFIDDVRDALRTLP